MSRSCYDCVVRDLAVLVLHRLATVARLVGPGGARSVIDVATFYRAQAVLDDLVVVAWARCIARDTELGRDVDSKFCRVLSLRIPTAGPLRARCVRYLTALAILGVPKARPHPAPPLRLLRDCAASARNRSSRPQPRRCVRGRRVRVHESEFDGPGSLREELGPGAAELGSVTRTDGPTHAPQIRMKSPLLLIIGLCVASPAWSQTKVYTNADLGRPLAATRPTVSPEILASLAAHQFRLPVISEGPTVTSSGLSPTGGPFSDYQNVIPSRRLDGSLWSDPPWTSYYPGFYPPYYPSFLGSPLMPHKARDGQDHTPQLPHAPRPDRSSSPR